MTAPELRAGKVSKGPLPERVLFQAMMPLEGSRDVRTMELELPLTAITRPEVDDARRTGEGD